MWSSRNKMLLDAEGDGEDDVAFLSGIEIVNLFVTSKNETTNSRS